VPFVNVYNVLLLLWLLCIITQTEFMEAVRVCYFQILCCGILGYVSPFSVAITWKTKNEMHIRETVCVNVDCVEVSQYCYQ
jgi:hypothetical protein